MLLDGVSVLVPYRPDDGARQEAWENVVQPLWEQTGAELIVESPGPGASPAEFNHPLAINRARERASGEVLIIADADCAWTPYLLPAFLVDACTKSSGLALPRRYAKLTGSQTRRLVRGTTPPSERMLQKAEWVGDAVSWSGLVCVRAEDFDAVGGYDERYEWWGSDDVAFGLSVETLLGPTRRIDGSVLHL
jgi:hypothetical protein